MLFANLDDLYALVHDNVMDQNDREAKYGIIKYILKFRRYMGIDNDVDELHPTRRGRIITYDPSVLDIETQIEEIYNIYCCAFRAHSDEIAIIASHRVEADDADDVEDDADHQVEDNVDHQVEDDADLQVEDDADLQVEDDVDHQVEDDVDHQVEDDVDHQVEDDVDHQVEDDVDQVEDDVDQVEDDVDHQVEDDADHQVEDDADQVEDVGKTQMYTDHDQEEVIDVKEKQLDQNEQVTTIQTTEPAQHTTIVLKVSFDPIIYTLMFGNCLMTIFMTFLVWSVCK
jgi:hypothetical protein